MPLFRDYSIKGKLTAISMLASCGALMLTCAAFITYDQISVRRDMIRELETTARIIGANSASSLSFADDASAAATLKTLAAQPHIVAACIYNPAGDVFATYRQSAVVNPHMATEHADLLDRPWPATRSDHAAFTRKTLELFHVIHFSNEAIGTIYLRSDLHELHGRLAHHIGIAGLILLASLLSAWLLTNRLQHVISAPVKRLVATAGKIGEGRDYALRATKDANDEIGALVDGFNQMLSQIEKSDAELKAAQRELEQRVEHRTEELRASEERIRLIVDTAFDAIVTTDARGRITAWNRQAETTFGWSSAEAIGHDLVDTVVAEPDREACRQRLRRFLESRDSAALSRRVEITALHRDGHQLPVELAISPVHIGDAVLFSAFLRDITEAKRADAELKQIHRQLLDTSRQAGMAEVATGVLHNVGNVLNSVNVSATLVSDLVRRSKAANVAKLRDLIDQHRADLARFLTEDPKGTMIPAYLGSLADSLATEQSTIVSELDSLHKNIGHIKDIVSMQQNYAKTFGVVETVSVPDLVEDALRMNAGSLARHDVDVARQYDGRPVITVEKNKVLQILVNLVRNAKYACDESGRIDKLITLRIRVEPSGVSIAVIDNGVGISAENLTRVFAHGFTTRKQGHGFGLHSGALAARELGGSLTAHSDGPGKGATFILKLPLSPEPDPS